MKDFGILVPVVTPCDRSGKVDYDGLRSVCSDMIRAGCHGIFVLGSTGRSPWFSLQTRSRICSEVAKMIETLRRDGRLDTSAGFHSGEGLRSDVALYAGCMASGIEDILENTRRMADAGAQVAVVTAPVYFRYNQDEVASIFLTVADRSPLPVLVYDIPAFTGIKLDTAVIARLANHENVVGLKDSSADIVGFRQLLELLEGESPFLLFQGKEHLLAESLLAGASGFVVSLIHIDPYPFVALKQAARAGDVESAHALQRTIAGVMELVESSFAQRPETSTLFHIINVALKQRGVCDNILLAHEGDCPSWLARKARQALSLCSEAHGLVEARR